MDFLFGISPDLFLAALAALAFAMICIIGQL